MSGITGRLLAALRGGNRRAENEAIEELLNELRQRARAYAPDHGRRVDAQLDSVVQSVVVDALPKAVERCDDDDGLMRYMGRALRNRFADRVNSRRHASLDTVEGEATPASPDPGPETVLFDLERGSADEAGRTAFEHAIRAAHLTAREREIATLFILREHTWEEVGAAVGMSAGAAKVAMTRMRPRLLETVLEPIAIQLSDGHWTLARSLLIDGRSESEVAAALGITPERVFDDFRDVIMPALRRTYGSFGVDRLNVLRARPGRGGRTPEAS